MKPCWSRSSPFPNQSGRQGSNLPRTAYETVASPLGFGPQKAPCTGLEPVSPARQAGRHTRCVTGRNQSAWRESNPRVRHGEPVPGPLGHRRISNSKGGRI